MDFDWEKLGECITCGCDTYDYRGSVRVDDDGRKYDDYQCEDCCEKISNEERVEHEKEFNSKVLPYLIENKFRIVATSDSKVYGSKESIYPVVDRNIMYCVDEIRDEMDKLGYYENWIDVHWEEYAGVSFEVVDYLCFALKDDSVAKANYTGDDEYCSSLNWVSFYFNLVGENDVKLNVV